MREARIHPQRLVGSIDELLGHEAQHVRQTLSAVLDWRGQRAPASFAVQVEGVLESLRRGDAAIGVASAALQIALPVERGEHFGRELAALLNHRIDHLRAGIFKAGQLAIAFQLE